MPTIQEVIEAHVAREDVSEEFRVSVSNLMWPNSKRMGLLVPVVENIHTKVYQGALEDGVDMRDWHCGTTHCRGGWAIHLAGPAGYDFEQRVGVSSIAAHLIYLASDPHLQELPELFEHDNDEALADMKACALDESLAARNA